MKAVMARGVPGPQGRTPSDDTRAARARAQDEGEAKTRHDDDDVVMTRKKVLARALMSGDRSWTT